MADKETSDMVIAGFTVVPFELFLSQEVFDSFPVQATVLTFKELAEEAGATLGAPFVGRIGMVPNPVRGGMNFIAELLETQEKADEYGMMMIMLLAGKAEILEVQTVGRDKMD